MLFRNFVVSSRSSSNWTDKPELENVLFGSDFLPDNQVPTKNAKAHFGFFTVRTPDSRFAKEHTGTWYLLFGTDSKRKLVNKIGVKPFLYNDIRKYDSHKVSSKRNIYQIGGNRVWRDTDYDTNHEVIQAFVESEVDPKEMILYYCYERETNFREMELPLFQ